MSHHNMPVYFRLLLSSQQSFLKSAKCRNHIPYTSVFRTRQDLLLFLGMDLISMVCLVIGNRARLTLRLCVYLQNVAETHTLWLHRSFLFVIPHVGGKAFFMEKCLIWLLKPLFGLRIPRKAGNPTLIAGSFVRVVHLRRRHRRGTRSCSSSSWGFSLQRGAFCDGQSQNAKLQKNDEMLVAECTTLSFSSTLQGIK